MQVAHPGKKAVFAVSTLLYGNLVEPDTPPLLSITHIPESGAVIPFISDAPMIRDSLGEFHYVYTLPSNLGFYKIKYMTVINSETLYGFDELENFDLRLFLAKMDVAETFSYNADQSVDKVLLRYGNPVVQELEMSFTYSFDKAVLTREIKKI